MDLALSAEQQLLQQTAREFMALPYDATRWQQAQQLGWTELRHSEAAGGLLEASILAIEMGRALWPAPFIESVARGSCEVGGLLTAAQLVGISEAALEMTVEHVKARHQFGRPTGSFQAARHRLADMSAELALSRVLVFKSAWLADRGEDVRLVVSQAKFSACRMSHRVIMGSHQLHGGVGYAADHRLPRYTMARLDVERSYGDAEHHLSLIQELLDLV